MTYDKTHNIYAKELRRLLRRVRAAPFYREDPFLADLKSF